MSGEYLLGIDTGTSVVKSALFDRSGRLRAVASRRTAVAAPQPGWSETSMSETWQAAVSTIREVLASAGASGEDVAAVGLTGQMLGAWLVDDAGEPVRSAIQWNDGRTQKLIEQLSRDRPSLMTDIFRISGSVMQQGCTLPVLRWLAENDPRSVDAARWALCSKDWIRYRLTDEVGTDPTDAALLPGNARTRTADNDVLHLLGVSQLRGLLPPVVASDAVAGDVTPEAAAATGLRPGTPVATGCGDVPAVALGVGAVEPGQACAILGTTLLNCQVLDRPAFEPLDIGLLFPVPGDLWLRAYANIAGTTNLDWLLRTLVADLAGADPFERLEGLVRESAPAARGVMYHPYLSAVGILAPIFEPSARAQFTGLSIEHERGDLVRAVYEGVALAVRDCYAVASRPVTTIRLSGGGARSQTWAQIIADVTGIRVQVPAGEEFGARGAALLAGVAIGWFSSIREGAGDRLVIEREHEPSADTRAVYDELFSLYRKIRRDMVSAWHARAMLDGAV